MKKRALSVLLLAFLALTQWYGCGHRATVSARGQAIQVAAPADTAQPATHRESPRSWQRPFLFRISGLAKPAYLLGTIHLPDARLDEFPKVLKAAYDASDIVYTEVPTDAATQKAMLPAMFLPQGQTLKNLLPNNLYDRLVAALAAKGLHSYGFERMKPWAVALQVAMLDQMFALALKKPLDASLEERAQMAGKEVGALETPTEQIAVFDTLGSDEQIEFLRQTLDAWEKMRANDRDMIKEMLDAFLLGDRARLWALLHEDEDPNDPLAAKITKRLLTDRNVTMAERIIAKMRAKPQAVQLFAVGSAHVFGDDGIVALLRRQGHEVNELLGDSVATNP